MGGGGFPPFKSGGEGEPHRKSARPWMRIESFMGVPSPCLGRGGGDSWGRGLPERRGLGRKGAELQPAGRRLFENGRGSIARGRGFNL